MILQYLLFQQNKVKNNGNREDLEKKKNIYLYSTLTFRENILQIFASDNGYCYNA